MMAVDAVPLHEATRERYLNYALSVITARALPDVRDGLKPVQRRILYTMFNELSLHPSGRYRKCAAVVGEVMGKFHPHGDQSIYDALVRMAQDFSLRAPLVDGQGNFGSLDGDPAAAMRYTECRLRPLAEELLTEIKKRTVDFRPSYDGQRFEPIVLPAQFPQLLVNGCEGIAVGMATRVPPHNLGEVIDACVALIDDRSLELVDLMEYVRGPDFPTGGRILSTSDEIQEIYATGHGSLKVRATWMVEREGRKQQIILTSVPYGQNKARLLEKIGSEVAQRKVPQLVDVRDESTDDVRIVLELKSNASAEAAMAYLFKHTPLEGTWPVNITCLVPGDSSDISAPAKLDLKEILIHWLDFRYTTVRRRFEYELQQLRERIHILEGFRILFDALDEAIAIIRASEGRQDASERLMERFELSEIQSGAILDLRLYKLARLEIRLIIEELEEKRAKAAEIERILASSEELWKVVRRELLDLRGAYATPRRTEIGSPTRTLTYDENAYIVQEDTYVIVTRDGWIKRQSSFSELGKIRIRDDDTIGWLFEANTRSTLTFFTTHGAAYTMRVDDVPATTGYGEPMQKRFSFADQERVISVLSHDARHRDPYVPGVENQVELPLAASDDPSPPWGIALSEEGRVLRFPLESHEDPSTRSGRKYAKLSSNDAILAVYRTLGTEHVGVATAGGRAMCFDVSEVPILKGVGKGVTGIKLRPGDRVIAFELAEGRDNGPIVFTENGREVRVTSRRFGHTVRGGRGKVVLKRGKLTHWQRAPYIRLGEEDDTESAPASDEVVQ